MTQLLATILFFVVFIEAFIALTVYIAVMVTRFFREQTTKQKESHK